MVFLAYLTYYGTGGYSEVVDRENQGILSTEMNWLLDREVELTNCKTRRLQVFLFIQISFGDLGAFFHYHQDPVWTFLSVFLAL